jgi:hypothetical protein
VPDEFSQRFKSPFTRQGQFDVPDVGIQKFAQYSGEDGRVCREISIDQGFVDSASGNFGCGDGINPSPSEVASALEA